MTVTLIDEKNPPQVFTGVMHIQYDLAHDRFIFTYSDRTVNEVLACGGHLEVEGN